MKEFNALVQSKDFSRSSFAPLVSEIVNSVLDGKEKAIDIYIQAKGLIDALNKIIDDPRIKLAALDEADLYDKHDRQKFGVKFQIVGEKETKKIEIDFSQDDEWIRLYDLEKAAIASRKAREALLNSYLKDGVNIDALTGEEITIVTNERTILSKKLLKVLL